MAANEVIELDSGSSSDDEFKDPPRKPIGWNYQGTATKNPKDMVMPKVNGAVRKPEKAEGNACSDEIEIVEMPRYAGKLKGNVFPRSSSRNEIRKIIRNTTQSDMGSFLSKKHIKTETDSKTRDSKAATDFKKPIKTETDSKAATDFKKPIKTETDSRTTDSKAATDSKTTDSKTTDSKTTDSNTTDTKTTDSNTTDSKTADSKTTVSKTKTDETVKPLHQNNDTKTEEKTKLPTVSSNAKKSEKQEENEYGSNEDENSETSIAAVESFVSRWEELKSSSDDTKIRDKLWKYYYLAHSSYTHSRRFISLVEGSTRKLSIDNIYVVVKDLLDSLKCYKDRPYRDKQKKNGEALQAASPLPEETEEEKKKNQKLRKVEKKMKEISDKIKDLETQEMDLDDDDNSAYLIEDRLKRQFSKLHDYYCKIAECTPATGRPIERKFRYAGSRYDEINKRISAWVNKTKEFPDYVDILNLLKKVTKESSLPLRPETVRVQAQEIFRDVGKLLKDRRESDDLYSIYSYIDDSGEDPANKDDDLSKKLSENEVLAKEKLDKIFQEYVVKESEARITADRNAIKKTSTEDVDKQGETKSTNQKNEMKTEGQTEEEEVQTEEEEEYLEDYEVFEEDAEADDTDGDDDVEEIYINDREVIEYPASKDDDDEDTDDELRDVIASASVEEELSEEDVPVIDSEEIKYQYRGVEEEEGSSSSIVCLDDTSSDSTITLDRTTSEPIKNENELPARVMDSSCKKRNFDEDFSPQKRPCLKGSNP